MNARPSGTSMIAHQPQPTASAMASPSRMIRRQRDRSSEIVAPAGA